MLTNIMIKKLAAKARSVLKVDIFLALCPSDTVRPTRKNHTPYLASMFYCMHTKYQYYDLNDSS